MFAFTASAGLITAIVFGLAPALEATGTDVSSVLKEAGTSVSGSRRKGRLRTALVVTQLVLAMVLLISTCLLVSTFRSIWAAPNGFDHRGILTFEVALDERRYPDSSAIRAFYDRALAALRPLAGQQPVAVAQDIPFAGRHSRISFRIEGRSYPDPQSLPATWINSAGPSYFETLKVPILDGRGIEFRDGPDAPRVAVVNQAFARQHFPRETAIGQRITLTRSRPATVEIVGVVGNIRSQADNGPPVPYVYFPFAQEPAAAARILIRSAGEPTALIKAAREVVAGVDPQQPIFNTKTMEDWVEESFAPYWILGRLAAGFGLLALTMTVIGVYGVVAFSVAQRTREFGIRAALGADRRRLMRMVSGQGLLLMLFAFVPGLLLSIAATMGLRSLLTEFGDVASATPVIGTVVAVLAAATLAATIIPARRAAAVDPVAAIRHE